MTANKVMLTSNPVEQKNLGRQVNGYSQDEWNKVCRDVVKRASMAKYSQNQDLHDKLLATKGTTLVEASPHDHKWGIGLYKDDPRALHRATWRGDNLLGEILTEVRSEIMEVSVPNAEQKEEEPRTNKDRFTLFCRHDSPFSEHYLSEFIVDGVTYQCAAQCVLHQRALKFDDKAMAARILETSEIDQLEDLCHQLTSDDDRAWNEGCEEIVKRAHFEKFKQNRELRATLLATKGTTLVNASPFDCKFGIGLGPNNPRALHRDQWRGKNLLGKILTEIRETLTQDDMRNKERKSQKSFKEFEVAVTVCLDSLSRKSYFDVSNRVNDLSITHDYEMDHFVKIFFERMLHNEGFGDCYAQLASELINKKIQRRSEGFVSFRRCLLDICQDEFITLLGGEITATKSTNRNKTTLDSPKQNTAIEACTDESKLDKKLSTTSRYIALIKFLGELYKMNILTFAIIEHCIDMLLKRGSDKICLQCASVLLLSLEAYSHASLSEDSVWGKQIELLTKMNALSVPDAIDSAIVFQEHVEARMVRDLFPGSVNLCTDCDTTPVEDNAIHTTVESQSVPALDNMEYRDEPDSATIT